MKYFPCNIMKYLIWISVISVPSVIPSIAFFKLNWINTLYFVRILISLSSTPVHEYIPKKVIEGFNFHRAKIM